MIGRVVSTKMNKQSLPSGKGRTVTVLVERVAKHPLYKKTFIRTKKYLVDDQVGVKDGDVVEIVKVRPISKNKHWKLIKVVGRNLEAITEEKLKTEAMKAVAEVMPEPSFAKASEGEKKEIVVDNSAEKSKSKKRGRTELSKK